MSKLSDKIAYDVIGILRDQFNFDDAWWNGLTKAEKKNIECVISDEIEAAIYNRIMD